MTGSFSSSVGPLREACTAAYGTLTHRTLPSSGRDAHSRKRSKIAPLTRVTSTERDVRPVADRPGVQVGHDDIVPIVRILSPATGTLLVYSDVIEISLKGDPDAVTLNGWA